MKFTDEYLKQQIKGCENYLETHEDELIVNRVEWDWHMSINDLCAALKEILRLREALKRIAIDFDLNTTRKMAKVAVEALQGASDD